MQQINSEDLLPGKLDAFIAQFGKRGEFYSPDVWDSRFGVWGLAWDTYWKKLNAHLFDDDENAEHER